MALFKSRYKDMTVAYNNSVIQFNNYEYRTSKQSEINYLKKLSHGDVICVSDKIGEQCLEALRLQARDLHFPSNIKKASKDDLIQFIESKK